jgi:cellobiose phosphorylase
MAVMFGNALYRRNASREGYGALISLFDHCNDFKKSKIYPGIPEYIDANGRGVYHYLTGAASWYLVTVITQMFGIRGYYGNLVFLPQLLKEQFDEEKQASVSMEFAGRRLKIVYKNERQLEPDTYQVSKITIDGVPYKSQNQGQMIRREDIITLSEQQLHTIEVTLN